VLLGTVLGACHLILPLSAATDGDTDGHRPRGDGFQDVADMFGEPDRPRGDGGSDGAGADISSDLPSSPWLEESVPGSVPFTKTLLDVNGGLSKVIAVGEDCTVIQRDLDNGKWSAFAPPQCTTTTTRFTAVWGTTSALFVATNDSHVHAYSSGWSKKMVPYSPGLLADLWGVSTSDVVVVGDYGIQGNTSTWSYNGNSWFPEPPSPSVDANLRGVWGTDPGLQDAFRLAVGGSGTLLWKPIGPIWGFVPAWAPFLWGWSGSEDFRAVWGSGPTDVFIVGDEVVAHFDGNALNKAGTPLCHFHGVWGSGPHSAYAVGSTAVGACTGNPGPMADGCAYQVIHDPVTGKYSIPPSLLPPNTKPLCSIWGDTSTKKVFAVGESGTILRLDL